MEEKEKTRGLRFGFIGVGQCGGNIANEFAKIGYKALAINTAKTDLDKLTHIKPFSRIMINTGIQGAGKDPSVGAAALQAKGKEVIQSIIQMFKLKETDVIFICAGLGGGTGSGMAPLLANLLIQGGFLVNMIVTIPSDDESPKAKLAALSAFGQLVKVEKLKNVFVIDNEKNPFGQSLSINNKYETLNTNIVNKLDILNIYTTRAAEIAFDEKDLLTLLRVEGASAIFRMNIQDVADLEEPEYLPQLFTEAIKDSCFANIDYKKPFGSAMLFCLPAKGSRYLKETSMKRFKEEIGTEFETYLGVYEKTEKADKEKGETGREGCVYVLISGLRQPLERLNAMDQEMVKVDKQLDARRQSRAEEIFTSKGRSLLDKYANSSEEDDDEDELYEPSQENLMELLKKM